MFMAFVREGRALSGFDLVPYIFEEAKKPARVAVRALEMYIVENFNPQIVGRKYVRITIK